MNPDGKVSLLVVDDDPHMRDLVEAAAVRAGCFEPIAVCADGEAALNHVRSRPRDRLPELVVSDLSMPRMTGIELIRALKADALTRSIPIAIITSSDVPNDRQDALAAGACIFEPKPHGLESLTKLLSAIRNNCCESVASGR